MSADFSNIFNLRSILSLAVYNYAKENPLPYVNSERHLLSAFFSIIILYGVVVFASKPIAAYVPQLKFGRDFTIDAFTIIIVVYCTLMLQEMLNVNDGFSWLGYGVMFLFFSIIMAGPSINYGTTRA